MTARRVKLTGEPRHHCRTLGGTMKRTPVVIALAASSLLLAGCASAGSSTSSATAAAAASTQAPASSAVGSAQPSSAIDSPSPVDTTPCTTHSCIAQDAQQSEVGTAAKDGSVITKAVCFKSTVQYSAAADTYTVSCDMTYTDGTVWSGLVTLLMASNQVSWQPIEQIQ